MAEIFFNLFGEIRELLLSIVRQRQNESGKTLSQYMTWLITTFYEMEDKPKMSKENTRTVAFQVPEELFERFKEYLSKHGIKQNAFFLDCIQRALAEDAEAAANE